MTNAELFRQAAQTIAAGSRSFAAASRLMDPATRESTVLLYAWCRHCDDVVDGQQLGHAQQGAADGAHRLQELQAMTAAACAGEPADDPVFAGLAEVVRRHAIPPELPLEHLAGFAMDVQGARYRTFDDLLQYCWRVAGVVGVMMARVMGATRAETLDRACDLGMAFQLTNIARDVLEDAGIGRVYLPADWLAEEGIHDLQGLLDPAHREALAVVAARLVAAAEPYYRSARGGIGDLPMRCAWSIATARDVYRAIGRKVVLRGPDAWEARVATSGLEKIWFVGRGAAVALAVPHVGTVPRPPQLFRRPL
jgi:phytoene synthase